MRTSANIPGLIAAIENLPGWVTSSFPVIRIIMLVLVLLLSVSLVILVFLQPSNSEGMGALSGQSSDTYYSKNKAKSSEGVFKRLTIVISIILAVVMILFFVSLVIYPAPIGA